jgi:hypothetical protein
MERSLKWTESRSFRRFGCTTCGWSHPSPSLKEGPESLDDGVLKFIARAFAKHVCAHYSERLDAAAMDSARKILILPSLARRSSWLGPFTQPSNGGRPF